MKKSIVIFSFFLIALITTSTVAKTKYEILQEKAVKRKNALEKQIRYLELDFQKCTPSKKGIFFDFGSARFQIIGSSLHGCVMLYGKEIENPRWDGFLNNTCIVSQKLGKMKFKINHYGPNLNKIKPYCVHTPKILRKREN